MMESLTKEVHNAALKLIDEVSIDGMLLERCQEDFQLSVGT